MMNSLVKKLKSLFEYVKQEKEKNIYKPMYKLAEIQEEEDGYTAVIKLINKNITYNSKPEEILANDNLVKQFSPIDIRTLTYLGYLGINSPKYKILAKKLSQDEKMIFVLKKRGEKTVITKTADQIIQETDIILNMNSEDAKTVGYIVASEVAIDEKKQKTALLKQLESEIKNNSKQVK